MDDSDTKRVVPRVSNEDLPAAAEELPIVARLVVEIRSDGSRTMARGAIANEATDERVALEAVADSPVALIGMLARQILRLGTSTLAPHRALGAGTRRRDRVLRALWGRSRDDSTH